MGNYLWCLVIVTVFMGLRGAKSWGGEGGGFKVIKWGQSTKREDQLLWGELTPLGTMKYMMNVVNFV